jgi:hypothetical protein
MSRDGLIRFLYVSGCQKRGSVSPFRGPGSISHSAGNELKRHEVSNSLSIPNYEKHKRIFLLCHYFTAVKQLWENESAHQGRNGIAAA